MRTFIVYATTGARNARATARLMTDELAPERAPNYSTIAEWAREDDWAGKADDVWRTTKGWHLRELQTLALANMMLSQQRRHEILLGQYEEQMGLALQYLKAGELADKLVRDVLPLIAMRPPEELTSDEEEAALTSSEKAIVARQRLIQRVKGEQVRITRTKSVEERKRELLG
jgi:hypothetical protein